MTNNTAGTLANTWLTALSGIYSADPEWFVGFGSTSQQDHATMVPLPPAVFLAATGLAVVAIGRRKLNKLAV